MEHDLTLQLRKLEAAFIELEKVSRRALGFVETIDFQGISFNVSRRFVIADLAPLAFFNLVEYIENDDSHQAVVRLYDRLAPLLSCRHDWVALRRAEDQPVRALILVASTLEPGPFICRHCTAYALTAPLPVIGRTIVQTIL